jgi:hypothetical protein
MKDEKLRHQLGSVFYNVVVKMLPSAKDLLQKYPGVCTTDILNGLIPQMTEIIDCMVVILDDVLDVTGSNPDKLMAFLRGKMRDSLKVASKEIK